MGQGIDSKPRPWSGMLRMNFWRARHIFLYTFFSFLFPLYIASIGYTASKAWALLWAHLLGYVSLSPLYLLASAAAAVSENNPENKKKIAMLFCTDYELKRRTKTFLFPPQGKDIYGSRGGTVKRLRQTIYSTRFASAKGAVLFLYSPGGQIARTRRCRRYIDAIFSSVSLLLLLLFPFFSLSPYQERK